MRNYYVDCFQGWFIVKTDSYGKARSAGVREFGRGSVKTVRLASDDEMKYFISLKGENAIEEIE